MKNSLRGHQTARRRKRFLLEFQRYLERYLKAPGFRQKAEKS